MKWLDDRRKRKEQERKERIDIAYRILAKAECNASVAMKSGTLTTKHFKDVADAYAMVLKSR